MEQEEERKIEQKEEEKILKSIKKVDSNFDYEKFKEFFDNIFDVLEIYDFIQKDKSSSEKEDNNSGN